MRKFRTTALVLMALASLALFPAQNRAQAALLMEEPYGFFGYVNPTGHNAVYFERICAETPVKLRRCAPGEPGAVISRFQGISGYDWVAIPLFAHLYAVDNAAQVPTRADHDTVTRMLSLYYETHLLTSLGGKLTAGGMFYGGWNDLVGQAYMRRIYAFRFETSEEQDNAFIARMNDSDNRSHFNPIYKNCADFVRDVFNFYFPHAFRREVFPDMGITTPKQTAYQLERYARKHSEVQLTVFEIPQIPGWRRLSHSNESVAQSLSLSTTGYAIAIAAANPYIAGGLFVDYLVHGRYPLTHGHQQLLSPDNLFALIGPTRPKQNSADNGVLATGAVENGAAEMQVLASEQFGPKVIIDTHQSINPAKLQEP
jgi:hypothetical protein